LVYFFWQRRCPRVLIAMETEYERSDSADTILVCVCCMLVFFGFLLGQWSSGQSWKGRSAGTSHSSSSQRLRSLRRLRTGRGPAGATSGTTAMNGISKNTSSIVEGSRTNTQDVPVRADGWQAQLQQQQRGQQQRSGACFVFHTRFGKHFHMRSTCSGLASRDKRIPLGRSSRQIALQDGLEQCSLCEG
jgi:hypothetical protein